jgi:hypothetical protein
MEINDTERLNQLLKRLAKKTNNESFNFDSPDTDRTTLRICIEIMDERFRGHAHVEKESEKPVPILDDQ